ncbi:MAG: outer membrane protein assembly factor BamD [Thalassotalea sp.]
MENLTTKVLLIALVLGLSACSSTGDDIEKVPDRSAQSLFVEARSHLDKGMYQKAIQVLSAIDSRFPYGPISHQVQLDLIYAYYKSGDTAQGVALTERFLKLNPDHPSIDYVYYMRGLIRLSEEKNLFQEFAGIDRTDRDPKPALNAFNDFKTILSDFPESKYAADARQRMVGIKSRLAQYEIKVARYYMKREAWASAANRGRYIVEYFAPIAEMEEALEIMIECYSQLGLNDLLTNAKQVMAVNYPKNKLLR